MKKEPERPSFSPAVLTRIGRSPADVVKELVERQQKAMEFLEHRERNLERRRAMHAANAEPTVIRDGKIVKPERLNGAGDERALPGPTTDDDRDR